MKSFGNFLFWFFVLLIAGNIALFALVNYFGLTGSGLRQVNSPLPKLLTGQVYNEASAQNVFWQPTLHIDKSQAKMPDLTAISALSYDLTTNSFLFEKDIDKKLPIASLTKIMTAIIALENMSTSSTVTVTHSAATIGEDSMGLSEGEKMTVEDLIYGLVLNSGNDAAETLAQGSQYGRADFIHLMNKKAEDLGLSNTRFTNPSGLQGDGEQYSTAKELLVLTRYALQKPIFAKAAATYEHDIPKTANHKAYTLYNETNLLTTYPGVEGVKTGYTDEAGLCLITYLDYQGHQIIAIILNSQDRRGEMTDLLDYSLKTLGITPPKHG